MKNCSKRSQPRNRPVKRQQSRLGQALSILDFTSKSASRPLKKVIASAIANAKNNFGLAEQTLKFKSIFVEKGPVLKRFRPVARGRAHSILKRTSRISVVLEGEPKIAKEAKET